MVLLGLGLLLPAHADGEADDETSVSSAGRAVPADLERVLLQPLERSSGGLLAMVETPLRFLPTLKSFVSNDDAPSLCLAKSKSKSIFVRHSFFWLRINEFLDGKIAIYVGIDVERNDGLRPPPPLEDTNIK